MDPLRIAIVSSAYPPRHTGAGLRASRLAGALGADPGFAPTVLTLGEPGEGEQIEESAGIRVQRLAAPPRGSGRLGRLLGQFRERRVGMRAARRLLEGGAGRGTVFHVFGATWFTLGVLAEGVRSGRAGSILEGTLLGVDDLGTLFGRSPMGRIQRMVFGGLVQRVGLHVCPAPEFADACRSLGVGPGRIWARPHPVDTSLFRPAADAAERERLRQSLELDPALPTVVMIGRFQPRKDQAYLIEAMRAVGGPCQLVLLGPVKRSGDEAYLASCKASAASLVPGVKVSFRVGSFDNVPEWLRACDVLAFSSTAEGFPNVVLEGLASGLRVVVRSDQARPWGVDPVPWGLAVTALGAPAAEFGRAVERLIREAMASGFPRPVPATLPGLATTAAAYKDHYRRLLAEADGA